MKLIWEPGLNTGVDWQDRQHREMFAALSDFVEAVRAGKGNDELLPFLAFVDRHATEHFLAEEQAMQSSGFPDQCRHVLEHRIFAQQLDDLRARLREGVHVNHLTEALHRGYDWLRRHVGGSDRDLGRHLQSLTSRQHVEEVDTPAAADR